MLEKIKLLLQNLRPQRNKQADSNVQQIHSSGVKPLSKTKQEQLHQLCEQLFKKQELITSGKLQFIGLSEVKKRMGRQWKGLSQIVYQITDEVIDLHLDKGDIFIRYKDDTYIIIFAYSSPEESNGKIARIVEDIQRRLFELDEEELRDIEIRRAISEIRTEMLMDAAFLDEMFGVMDDNFGDLEDFNYDFPAHERAVERDVQAAEVRAQRVKAKKRLGKPVIDLSRLCYHYSPLWDKRRGALTTYLCLAGETTDCLKPMEEHKALYSGRTADDWFALDKALLKQASLELENMARDNRKFFLVCPVVHQTLYRMESYEEYKKLLAGMPEERRRYLLLKVMNFEENDLPKNPYWFARPLRALCPHVMAEVPLRRDINFNYLRNSGVDVAGVRLEQAIGSEKETLAMISNFANKAKAMKIPQTFITGISTLSLFTWSVCAGFDYLGGPAIHGPVKRPDGVHKYQHADLVKDLIARP